MEIAFGWINFIVPSTSSKMPTIQQSQKYSRTLRCLINGGDAY